MLEKEKRVVDKELLHFIRYNCPCVACYQRPEGGVDAHHLNTVKTGGSDTVTNCIPLCRSCHCKIHQYGISKMIKLYPSVKTWLELAGREDVLLRAKRLS